MKRFLLFFLILFFSCFLLLNVAKAQEQNKINIYFFWQQGCPHCASERPFLENLIKQNPAVELQAFDISSNKDSLNLLIAIGKKLDINVSGVPFTLVGENYFIGWYDEQTTGLGITKAVEQAIVSSCRDVVKEIQDPKNIVNQIDSNLSEESCEQEENINHLPQKINLPLLGDIEIKKISLPVLTVAMGALDGFNPCAMWTLLFLISLLLGIQDRKRMWILGTAFIIISALVYFVFMAAWLNLILFLGFVVWVRVIIGGLALFGGGYNIKEFLFNKNSGCKVTNDEKRQKVFEKLKKIIGQHSFWLALGGIILLAFAVNLVELICSAGLPAVYTQVLALSDLAKWQYYLYILLYIFFFMLDDLFVFFVAMTTLRMTGITTKYSRYSKLIGGALMLIIGLLLLFKPEWLMFG
ncbi:MAG TPA: hypothetical protein PLK76_01475 [bacterium]|nr:hypothetical protein [bacterium]